MHLVKWIRKNTSKIMVFVIIFAMLAFVIGQFGLKMIVGLMGGGNQLVGTYDDNQKIKSPEFLQAQNELAVLRMLMADRLLLGQSQNGLSGPLLAYLLFPDSQFSSEIASMMKRAVQQGQLPISQSEIDSFFQQEREKPEVLWILLNEEARRAGCVTPNESALQTLRYAIPQMTSNQVDAAMIVSQIINKNNISKEQVLRIFSDFLAILSYANNVMDNQTVTINQIKAELGRSKERLDAEFVKIDAKSFIDENTEITDEQLKQQFETHKAAAPEAGPTQGNPFGFGYMLPKQVQLEYMVILIDDVQKQIEKPTAEALEDYYSQNIDRFKTSKPSDPNNPDSEKITTIRPFADVQASIQRSLENEKTMNLANIIFNDIKAATEAGLETINFDEASAEQLQKAVGDYVTVAEKLAQKYQVPINAGRTGWLSVDTFNQDNVLGKLTIRRGQQSLRLSDLAFAATTEKQESQRIGMPSVRAWENIGPLNGGYSSPEEQKYVRLMALVRVVEIQDARIPDSIDVAFETHGVTLNQKTPSETSFSVKEQVKQDILTVRAMDTAKARAEELAILVADTSWNDAIAAYNKKYANLQEGSDSAEEAANDAQQIDVETMQDQLRMSQTDIQMAKRYTADNPAMAQRMNDLLVRNLLINQLYAMLPENAESTGTIQELLVFAPQAACYVVKDVTRKPATMNDYLDNKAQTALQLNMEESAALALIHFSPEKILERMNYQSKLGQEPIVEQESLSPDDIDI